MADPLLVVTVPGLPQPQGSARAFVRGGRAIVTSDNPRSEDPDAIIAEVVAGCEGPVEVVPDRAAAIAAAVEGVGPDDVVLVAGKGHEQGQVIGATTVPFDDRDQVRGAIERTAGGGPR